MKPDETKEYQHILRIANTDLKGEKTMIYGLAYIKGVGPMFANAVCRIAGLDPGRRLGTLKREELQRISEILEKPASFGVPEWLFNRRKDYRSGVDVHVIGNDLAFATESDIKLMKKIKCYKGIRHMLGAPVRGQRTRSNFRKNKGKVMGVQRKRITAPAAGDAKKEK